MILRNKKQKNEKPNYIKFNKENMKICLLKINDEHYWMLLCHDRRDHTLFNIIPQKIDII